ncbi:hypothetical protein GCM10023196_003890 [Actinoallomurus vinaceus]|uniref:Uncharacterized protein n=1 Tax=Actinoallomurus vinaceus TaxID=1080074 RepID=A0ABP8U4F6_9ACTN
MAETDLSLLGVDTAALYDLGNYWIMLGDALALGTQSMVDAVASMSWTGDASKMVRMLWSEVNEPGPIIGGMHPHANAGPYLSAGSAEGIPQCLLQCRDAAYEIGGAINYYADQVLAAVEKYNKEAKIEIVLQIVGIVFDFFAFGPLGELLGAADAILTDIISNLVSVVSRIAKLDGLIPETVLRFAAGAVSGAVVNVSVEFTAEAIANAAVGNHHWTPNPAGVAGAAGLGSLMGSMAHGGGFGARGKGGFDGLNASDVPSVGKVPNAGDIKGVGAHADTVSVSGGGQRGEVVPNSTITTADFKGMSGMPGNGESKIDPTGVHSDPSGLPGPGGVSVKDGLGRPDVSGPAPAAQISGGGSAEESARPAGTPRPEPAVSSAGGVAGRPPADHTPTSAQITPGEIASRPGGEVVAPGPADHLQSGRPASADPGAAAGGRPGSVSSRGGPGEPSGQTPVADNGASGVRGPGAVSDGLAANGGNGPRSSVVSPQGRPGAPASERPASGDPSSEHDPAVVGRPGTAGPTNGDPLSATPGRAGAGGPESAVSPQGRPGAPASERPASGDPSSEHDPAVVGRPGTAGPTNGDPLSPTPGRTGAGDPLSPTAGRAGAGGPESAVEAGRGVGAAGSVAGPSGARPGEGAAAAAKPQGDGAVPPAGSAEGVRGGRSVSADSAASGDRAVVPGRGGAERPSGQGSAGDVEDAGARDAGAVSGGAAVNGGGSSRVPAGNPPARSAGGRAETGEAPYERDAVVVDRSGPAGSANGGAVPPASARAGAGRSESAVETGRGVGAAESVAGPSGARPGEGAAAAAKPRGDEAVPPAGTGRTSPPKSPERPAAGTGAKAEGPSGGSSGSKVSSSEEPPSRTPGQESETVHGTTRDSAVGEDVPTGAVRSDERPTGSIGSARTGSEPRTPRDEHAAPAEDRRSDAGSPRAGSAESKDAAGDGGPQRSAVPRRDGPSAGPADDARRTPASPEGRSQESARPSAPADRGERPTGPSGERDASGGHGAHRPEAGEEAAALVSQHGPLTKVETWQAFKNTRDADYAGRFSKEERFAHATRDLDVDHEVASAERHFREDDPDLAAHLPADGTAAVSKGFREALHDAFSSAWKKSAGRPEETDTWSKTFTRLRQELPDRFAQVSLQHREISRMDTALNEAADRFGENDLFRGNYLPKEKFDENAVKFDETTGTFSVDHEKAGPYGKLRLDVHKDVVETVNSAWRDAGGLPTGEAARGLENDLGQIRDGLHERLENLSNQERQVRHGERALDEEHSARGTPLSRDVLDRVRKEFGDEIRSRYNELREQATGRDAGWFDRAWDAADEHMRGTDALRNRLDHGEFRENALQQGKQALRKAVARAQGEDGGESLGEYVGPEGEERLTTDWTKAVEKAVDDHWSSLPGRDFRSTGRPQESVRSSVDDDAVSSRGSVPELEDDVSLHEGSQMSWEERFRQLSDTLPQRIAHEFDKNTTLRQAANDFEQIAGHPDDLSAGHTVTPESFEKLSSDFRTDTVTEYDRLWGPEGTDSKAWLEHEAQHENVFETTLTGLREAPYRPGDRGPEGHAEESAAGGPADPRPPDDDTSGPAVPSSGDRPTPTAASADRPVPEPGARPAEHMRSDPGQVHAEVVRERLTSSSVRSPGSHEEGLGAKGAGETTPKPVGSDPGQVHARVVRERPMSSSVRSPGSHEEGLGAKGAGDTTPKPTGEHDLVETPESSVATPSEIVDGFTKTLNRVGETAAIRDDAYKTFQTQFEARYPELRTRPAVRDVTPVREWFADRWTAAAKEAGGSEHLTTATQERLKGGLASRLPTGTRPPADDGLQQRYEWEFRVVALRVESGTDYANPDPTWDQTTTDLFHQGLDRLRERYVADRIPLGVNRTEQVEHLQQVIVKAATMLRARVEPIGATVHAFNERTRDMSPHAERDQALKRDPALFSWYRRQQENIVRRFSDALELHGPGAELERVFQQRITTLRDMAWSRLEASREFGRLLDKAAPQELATPAARTWAADQVEEVRESFIQAHLDWRATVTPPEARGSALASAGASGSVDSPVVADRVVAVEEPARVEEARGSASVSAEASGSVDSPVVADRVVAVEEPARVEEARSSASVSAGASGWVVRWLPRIVSWRWRARGSASVSAEASGSVVSPVVADRAVAVEEPARAEEARGDDDYGLHKSGWRPLKDDDASSSYSQEHEWLLGDDSDSASAEASGSVDSPDVADRVLTSEEQDRLDVMQRRVIRRQQKRVNKAIARAAAYIAAEPQSPFARKFNLAKGAVSSSALSVVRDRLQSGFDDVIARETSPRKTLFHPGPESVDVRIADLKARISGPVDRLVKGIGWALEREAAREATIARARAMVDTAARTWQTVLEQSTALRNRLGVQRPVPADVFGAIREGFAIRAGARFDSVFDRDSESRTAPVRQSHEQLEKLLNADESRLHDWFLLPIAHRALVAEATRTFDERFDTTDAGRELAPWQVGRLRNAFAALGGEVFKSVFDSVTADPVDLTARIWEWEDRMNGLLGELAGLVGVESAATEEPRADTTSFHRVSDEYDVAQDELATGDRDDRASAGVVESPMHEPADLDAVRESLGERSAGEAEAPARGTDDAVESQIGTPAPADDAERAVSDLGEMPVLRELGAESSDYNLDAARELLEKEYEESKARHNNAMLEARRIIRELVGRTPSISDPGGVVSDIDRARILTAAWIARMGSEHAKEFADSALTLVPSREPMASEPEQFTRANLMAKAPEADEWLNDLADETREKLLDRARQIVADHHEPPPVGGTVESLRQREAYEAVLQVVAHAMAKAALDGASPEQAEAEADGLASWLAGAPQLRGPGPADVDAGARPDGGFAAGVPATADPVVARGDTGGAAVVGAQPADLAPEAPWPGTAAGWVDGDEDDQLRRAIEASLVTGTAGGQHGTAGAETGAPAADAEAGPGIGGSEAAERPDPDLIKGDYTAGYPQAYLDTAQRYAKNLGTRVRARDQVVIEAAVNERMEPHFRAALRHVGIVDRSMPPNGDCFFETLLTDDTPAVVTQRLREVLGTEPTVGAIRAHMADYLAADFDFAARHPDAEPVVAHLFPNAEEPDAQIRYVEDIRRMGSYNNDASDMVPAMFSLIFGIPIVVWQPRYRSELGWRREETPDVVPMPVIRRGAHYYFGATPQEPTLLDPVRPRASAAGGEPLRPVDAPRADTSADQKLDPENLDDATASVSFASRNRPAAGSAVTASTDGVDETVHDYADLNRARRALAKQSGSRYDDPMEKAWTIVRDRSGLRPTWKDLGGEVSDVDRIRLLVAAHIARERSDGYLRSDVDRRASEPVRLDHSGEVSDVDREAAPTVHDRSAAAFADSLLAALSASAPSRWTSDLTAEVNGILGRWGVPLSTSEEAVRAYHGLPDEDRKGPMRTVAQRIADRLVNGESPRLPGGAIGAEFESVIKLHADADLWYGTPLANNERLGFKLVVDHRNFFVDTAGDYYPTAELFKASNKPLKERQDKTPIVEFVTRPGGIPGEHKKWTIKEIIAQVSTTINALAKAEEPLSIAEWLPESEGWTVHRPEIRAEVLPIRTGQADDVTLYAQYTVDLRPTELYGVLQDVLAQGKQGTNSARFLQQGLEFGTEIARDFAALLTGTELPSSAVDVLDEIEPVAAVRGFLALVYPHITAIFQGALLGTNLIKNWVLAASRTDFAAIRGLLPEASRLFLEFYTPAIEKRLVEKFREGSPELDEQAAGANLLAKRLWTTGGTIGDYLNSALLEPQRKPVDQLTGIGMWTHNRRTHDGQLAVELRGWGPYPIGLGEVPEVIDSLGTMLADRENRAGRKRFQTSARGPRLLDAARLLADHPRAAAFRSFNEDGLGQLKRIWRKKHSKDDTELLPVADVATILVGLRALDVPEPTSAQDVADAIEVLRAASNRLKLIAADKSTAIQNMAHGALERLEAVLEPLHAYTPPSTGQEQADAGAFTADHSQISLDLWQVASLLSETSPEERVRVFGDFLMGLDATWRPHYARGELFPVADVATVLRGLRSPHDEDVPLDIEDDEPLSRLRSHLETLADDPQVGDQARETLQNLDALEAYFWSSNIVSSPDALGEIESGLEPDVAPSVPGSPSVGLDEFEFGLAPGSPSSVPVSPRELVASEPDPVILENLMSDAAEAERWLDELQEDVRNSLLARAGVIVGVYHEPLPVEMTGERVERLRPVYEAVLLVVATALANSEEDARDMASGLAGALGTRRRTAGAPPGGSRPPVELDVIGGGGESSGAVHRRPTENVADELPPYVDREVPSERLTSMAGMLRVSQERLAELLQYDWLDEELFATAREQAGLVGDATELADFAEQIGRIPDDLQDIATLLAPMRPRDVYLVSQMWDMDPRWLLAFPDRLRDFYSRTSVPDLDHRHLELLLDENYLLQDEFERAIEPDELALIGKLCYQAGISAPELGRLLAERRDGLRAELLLDPNTRVGARAEALADLLLDLEALNEALAALLANPSLRADLLADRNALAEALTDLLADPDTRAELLADPDRRVDALVEALDERLPGLNARDLHDLPGGNVEDLVAVEDLVDVEALVDQLVNVEDYVDRRVDREAFGIDDLLASGYDAFEWLDETLFNRFSTANPAVGELEAAAAIVRELMPGELLESTPGAAAVAEGIPVGKVSDGWFRDAIAQVRDLRLRDGALYDVQRWARNRARRLVATRDLSGPDPVEGDVPGEDTAPSPANSTGVSEEALAAAYARAGIGREDFSAVLLGANYTEGLLPAEVIQLPTNHLRRLANETLDGLREETKKWIPQMPALDVAWIRGQFNVEPKQLELFETWLKAIYSNSDLSLDERFNRILEMFGRLPGVVVEDDQADVLDFIDLADREHVSAEELSAFLILRTPYGEDPDLDKWREMDPEDLQREIREGLDALKAAAESLAPMGLDDVAWVSVEIDIELRDLWIFGRELRGIYSRTPENPHANFTLLRREQVGEMFRAVPGADVDGDIIDVSDFVMVAGNANVSADVLRTLLLEGGDEAQALEDLIALGEDDLGAIRRVFRDHLSLLGGVAASFAAMGVDDVAWVSVEGNIDPRKLWIFGRGLSGIYSQIPPDNSYPSLESFRQERVRKMFRAVRGAVVDGDSIDVSDFVTVADLAGVSADVLSSMLVLKGGDEAQELEDLIALGEDDLGAIRRVFRDHLSLLRGVAASFAAMGVDDVAWVSVEGNIDPRKLWIFGRGLSGIYSQIPPDNSYPSLESFRQERVRKMFRAVPGAVVDGDSIDVSDFATVADRAGVSADVLSSMLVLKGGDASQELEDLMGSSHLRSKVGAHLTLLEDAAESLPMSADDVAWFSARTGVRPNDLKIFDRELREIYHRASDTGPSRAEPQASLTDIRSVLKAEARLNAATRMLSEYASSEDIADFAAMAAHLGTDAKGMHAIVEAARRAMDPARIPRMPAVDVAFIHQRFNVEPGQLWVFETRLKAIYSNSGLSFEERLDRIVEMFGRLPGVFREGDHADASAFTAIAVRARVSAEELSAFLIQRTAYGAKPQLDRWSAMAPQELRRKIDKELSGLRQAAGALAPMGIDDVAWVSADSGVEPEFLPIFGRELREIHRAFDADSSRAEWQEQVKAMLRDLPGAVVNGDSIDVSEFVTVATVMRESATDLNARLARAAERLAPMSAADLFTIGMQLKIDPWDLVVFREPLRGIQDRGLDMEERAAEISGVLADYTAKEHLGEFAALAARLGIDAEGMRTVVEAAEREMNLNVTDLRRVSPYDLLDLLPAERGTQAEGPSRTSVDHPTWFEQARSRVEGLSRTDRRRLLVNAGEIVALHHEPLPVDLTTVPPARRAQHEGVVYAVAERLLLEDEANGSVDEAVYEAVRALSRRLAAELGTQRRTGGAPPGSLRRTTDFLEIGGGGAYSGSRAETAPDRAVIFAPAEMGDEFNWTISKHSKGPYCVQVAVVGGGRRRGGRVRRC